MPENAPTAFTLRVADAQPSGEHIEGHAAGRCLQINDEAAPEKKICGAVQSISQPFHEVRVLGPFLLAIRNLGLA